MAERELVRDVLLDGQRFTCWRVRFDTVRQVRGFNRLCHAVRHEYRIDGRRINKLAWLAIVHGFRRK